MKKFFRSLALAWVLFLPMQGHAAGIWVLCDHCSSTSSFADVALNASQEGTVFVSNRSSRETRKYYRLIQWDRTSQSFQARATPRSLTDDEKLIFDGALENGSTVVVATPRNDSGITQWGLPSVGSVVEDIANGSLSPALINAISNHVLLEGFFPTASGLSQSLGFSIKGIFDWRGNKLGTSRNAVLNLIVSYRDGSRLFVTFSKNGEVLSVSGVDAGGNGLALTYTSSSGAMVDPGRTGSWEFGSDSVEAAEALGAWIGGAGTLNCHFEEVARDRVRVTCVRD